ncbi:MAG TPA: efflux RND transporter periplasmic adaptor subunit [Gammaproteobacteria bacterium]|nr:efflux RND transporter periplasmic adaptor subunit [Gammaproteobacteria bacterium]
MKTERKHALALVLILGGSLVGGAASGAADRHAGEGGDPAEPAGHKLHLTEAQRGRLDLQVAEAEAGSAEGTLEMPATVHFDADRVARIGPRLRAKVVRVTKDLGTRVEKGETVAIMDSVALGKAKARYLTAQAAFETARADFRREQELADKQISSEAELLDARARFREARARRDAAMEELRLYGIARERIRGIEADSRRPLSRYRLTSPLAGVVQKRDLTPGQTVGPEETPIHVVDTGRVWVLLEAYERHLPMIESGQTVRFRSRALGERRFTGKIDWISRELDAQTRTVRVRAVVANADGLLRAGMFGKATVSTAGGRVAMVPVDAVQTIEDRPMVFVPGAPEGEARASRDPSRVSGEDGHFRAVPVTLGQEAGGRVEVLDGIQPGDRLVVRGAFDLKSALTAGGRSAAHHH